MHGNDFVFSKYMKKTLTLSSSWNHILDKLVWRKAHALTSPSNSYAKEVANDMGYQQERIHVIPNPVNSELLRVAREGVDILRSAPDRQYICYVGRIAEVKGIFPFLHAAREVQKTFPQLGVVLAGPWQLRQTPEKLGITKNDTIIGGMITWTGFAPLEKLTQLYRHARVCVIPSYFESFGIAAVEAMACGKVVIAARSGGLAEIIDEGKTGFLLPPGNAQALADKIIEVINTPSLQRTLGQAARQKVLERYDTPVVVSQMLKYYQSILEKSL
jgi:1,4-alpha-glucan branching enzyme